MRKYVLVFIAVIVNTASAQIGSGTIIVTDFAKDKVTVAADSRETIRGSLGELVPDDHECKISAFRNQFIFASSGANKMIPLHPGDSTGWKNSDLAGAAVSDAKGDDLTVIAGNWATDVVQRWTPLCAVNREACVDVAALQKGILTTGMFYRVKGLLAEKAVISFDALALLNPIQSGISEFDPTTCFACGQASGKHICLAGHVDVAQKFCSERKLGDKISIRTPLHGHVTEDTKLTVKIVEMTIDAYSQNGGGVGGTVDSVTITKSGIAWNSRKKECPEKQ